MSKTTPSYRQSSGPGSPTASPDRALLDKYCVSCHNGRLKTAGLMLDSIDVTDVSLHPNLWEKVARKVRAGAMPPVGRPRPDQATSSAFISQLEAALDRSAAAKPNPGRPAIHRLNRAEYTNAVRDLLALEIDGRSLLPADDADQHGFDNIAEVLSVSPALLERYMSAARKIGRLAVGRPTAAASSDTYNVPRMLVQDGRMSEDLPFGSRGGLAVRHQFPVDGEYRLKIHLQTNLYDYIRGLASPHDLEVRLDGARVKAFTVGGELSDQGAPESYAGAVFGSPEWEKYTHDADAGLEVGFSAKAGGHVVGVSFTGDASAFPEGVLQPRQTGYPLAVNEMNYGNPAVDRVDISGPYTVAGPGDTPSRRRIFVCQPARIGDEEPCARTILGKLARRAYRRPVGSGDLDTVLEFYRAGRREGIFDAGIQMAIERVLADPEFLFRVESDPQQAAPGSIHRISDLELASRLSFFLWSSIPDDELLNVASRGRLSDPAVLEQQVRRMLADQHARNALVDNFAGQWLELRNLREATPDPDLFTDFDENLREAFRRETELFFGSLLREDRSVTELLTANYTFVNERLARYYGIPNVSGDRFRRVVLSREQERGGLLGHGSVLTVTSYPNRTSPVLRGKWILMNLLGTPPPPPPPNVPALKDKGDNGKLTSVRARLEAHRQNAVCATCHSQIDPLGFALESFDAVGQWRTTAEGGAPVDTSSVLSDGTRIAGMRGLRDFLLGRREQVVRTITEKLLTYALGRGLEYYDIPTVRQIAREAESNDYRWSAIVIGIVKSAPFQLRRSAS